ncbi:carbohydrate binding family 9 domain-containing protein [bacterium]|nr:carbohydrate binding family 9 domain-containing protein [bacterium]
MTATRTDKAPIINGILDDSAWEQGVVVSTFIQKEPEEFGQPSQKTEVVVLYDERALYVGARMYDSAPDSIIARLVRRDVGTESDLFGVFLDPYHDHRSGFQFALNAAGTRYDGIQYNDSWSDDSWDGVWEGKVRRDGQGWCAEFRIPFSQLRFRPQDRYVWGINFVREIGRNHEEDFLVFTPKKESGFVSRFWHLEGIEGISPGGHFEVLPYTRGKAHFQDPEDGDPFNDGSEYHPNAGVDVKMGIGTNLVLNATVNPDFGQVEVDPAVINLSDVETFFSEKRPFFIEGSKNFEFGYGGATDYWGFNWSTPDFFYSRRIGRAPQAVPDYDYADVPEGAHILGAAKLTGKLGGQWNFGSLHAVSMRETAEIEYDGKRSDVEVEPATYYMVTRTQREIAEGRQGIGGIATASHRFFDDPALESEINEGAYTAGMDGWTAIGKDRDYMLAGWLGASHVRGSEERILDLQESSRHYFQRPDVSHVEVDSTATSLSGFAGRILINKEKGNIFLNTGVATISPGFDVNDVGFMYRADVINSHLGSGYRWTDPTSWTRYAHWIAAVFSNFDYDGNHTWGGVYTAAYLRFLNYYTLSLSAAANPNTTNTTRTRGGPRTLNKAGWELSGYGYTDSRRKWVFGVGSWGYTIARDDWSRGVWADVEWKPVSNLSLSTGPELSWNQDWLRWVDYFDDETATHTYGRRYVFGEMYQTEFAASFRVNWTFTPKLSLQLYAQPLISSGDYNNFKELSRPNSNEYRAYPEETVSSEDDTYTIDPDGDGPAEPFAFDNPDFDYRSLRGNVILRWEYLPGSTFYLVWTHGRWDDETRGRFDVSRSLDRLSRADLDNIFLLKATYWLNI